jgi:redox-sensitive bicupin YhaK (pirin superfamily)
LRVIAGESHGVAGAMQREVTEPLYLNLELPAGTRFAQVLPPGHNAFVYVYRGGVTIGGTPVPVQRMAILANGEDRDGVVLAAPAASRALLIAGRPLHEPIAQYGPFVMNSHDEIFAAVQDYQAGTFTSRA